MLARGNGLEWIVRLLVTIVPGASLAGVVLLLCDAFTPQRALLIGAVLALPIAHRLPLPDLERWPAKGRAMLGAIIVLACLVRWPAALYLQGGQDQGGYVAMASHFAETGDLDVVDALRARLQSPEAIRRYDANNTGSGLYQPGIYTVPSTPGRYVFQFYPVHPLWMAIFGGMLGLEQAAASQIFFALVSLLFAALIAERLTGNWRAGVAYAAILGLLPLHLFFSKFPISEMPTLAFALMGWFAISCYQEPDPVRHRILWLIVAALCFLTLFCTRISGFIYLPVFFLGALLSHVFVEDARVRRQWAACWLLIAGAYALSVWYGLTYSHRYARDIYVMGVGERIYAQLPWLVSLLVLAAAAPFLATLAPQRRRKLRELLLFVWTKGQPLMWVPLVAFVTIGLIRIALLAFTDHYQGNPWYDALWGASHGGEDTWRQGSFYIAAAHLSPVVAALVPLSLWRPGTSAPRALLVAMVLTICAYTALAQWFVPYQYYYARYQLSELIPYALLMVVVRCHDRWHLPRIRAWLLPAFFLTGAYFAWYAWPLIGFRESDGVHGSLARVATRMDSNDVLLFDESALQNPHQIVTPLRFFFQRFVYTYKNRSQLPDIVRDLSRGGFGDIYLMSSRGAQAPDGFGRADDVVIEQTTMTHEIGIPRESESSAYQLAFYRFDSDAFNATAIASDGLSLETMHPSCCEGVYPDNSWTNGDALIRGMPLPSGQWHRLLLRVRGNRADYDEADVKVSVNGRLLLSLGFQDSVFSFDLGTIEGPTRLNVRVSSNTFVPKQRGIGEDGRDLGIDIDTFRVQ
jgi:hypothetical protein